VRNVVVCENYDVVRMCQYRKHDRPNSRPSIINDIIYRAEN